MSLVLLFQGAATESAPAGHYSPPRKKKRYYAEIGGARFLFSTEQAMQAALDRAKAIEAPEVVAKPAQTVQVKKAEPQKAPEPVLVVAPNWDEEDELLLLMA